MRWIISIFILLTAIVACSSWSRNNAPGSGSEDILRKISGGTAVHISNQTISDQFDLTTLDGRHLWNGIKQITIEGPIVFENCTFERTFRAQAEEQLLRFSQAVMFKQCIFEDSVLISRAEFDRQVDFDRCHFKRMMDARTAVFHSGVRFTDCRFEHTAYFQAVEFDRRASFFKSQFQGTANFQYSQFKDRADFGATVFAGYTEFTHVRFDGPSMFSYLESSDRFVFNYNLFRDRTDLLKLQLEGRVEIKGNTFFIPPRIGHLNGENEMTVQNNSVVQLQPLAFN